MVRLNWKDGPAISGLLKIVLLGWWLAITALSSFLLLPIFGWIAVYAWIAGNVFLVYMLNQSRKHSKGNVFDDKLSPERMADAEKRYIEQSLQEVNAEQAQLKKKNEE